MTHDFAASPGILVIHRQEQVDYAGRPLPELANPLVRFSGWPLPTMTRCGAVSESLAQRTKRLARNHKTVASPPIIAVGRKSDDLWLFLIMLGAVVTVYALYLAFGLIAPAG